MKAFTLDTAPDQHLFTIRGRLVMFRKSKECFGALHAVERGYFPMSATGYYSLTMIMDCEQEELEGIGFLDLLDRTFLESIAYEKECHTDEILRDALRHAKVDVTCDRSFLCSVQAAERAFEHGLFATDTQRRQLWQAAHETYANIFDSPFIHQAAPDPQRRMEAKRQTLDTLHRCMNGDFTFDEASLQSPEMPSEITLRAYLKLPPRPGGEPVIAIPTRTQPLEFDFGA